MKTKYGNLPDEVLTKSLDRLVAKVYKILPMKEEECETLSEYIEGIIRELSGQRVVVDHLKNNEEFLSLIGTIESLINQEEKRIYKKDIFKCINLIKKIQENFDMK